MAAIDVWRCSFVVLGVQRDSLFQGFGRLDWSLDISPIDAYTSSLVASTGAPFQSISAQSISWVVWVVYLLVILFGGGSDWRPFFD